MAFPRPRQTPFQIFRNCLEHKIKVPFHAVIRRVGNHYIHASVWKFPQHFQTVGRINTIPFLFLDNNKSYSFLHFDNR